MAEIASLYSMLYIFNKYFYFIINFQFFLRVLKYFAQEN